MKLPTHRVLPRHVLAAALVSALLHPSLGAEATTLPPGLEGLRESHYPRLLYRALKPACRRLCSR